MIAADAGGRPDGADRPDPNDRACDRCGHIWFAGERDHALLSPRADRDGAAGVLCALCLDKRSLARP